MVEAHLFKNSSQSGFLRRNQAYAENVKAKENFTSNYLIDPASVSLESENKGFIVKGNIKKQLLKLKDADIKFPFELSLVEGNNLRLRIDEERNPQVKFANPKRYDEAGKLAFQNETLPLKDSKSVKYEKKNDKLVLKYGDKLEFKAELAFHPISLSVFLNDKLQMVVNDQQFLNMEHYRVESENAKHLSDEEIDFDMFKDSSNLSGDDTMPFGPESIGLDFTFKGFKHLYGIPAHADTFQLKDTKYLDPYRLFNTDVYRHEVNSRQSLYGAVPLMTTSKPGVSMGLFWVNCSDTYIDIDTSSSSTESYTHWVSENGVLDFIISIGTNPSDINKSYGVLTGFAPIPPLFSLGYHQCRFSYDDQEDVLTVSKKMDENGIPCDTLWLDIGYTDGRKYFTWNSETFPDPDKMVQELDESGRNLVVIIDPHMKVGHKIAKGLVKRDLEVKNNKNKLYHAECWPGESLWIDTLNPSSQEYWNELHRLQSEYSLGDRQNIYLWNDMNEPSVFGGPEVTSPKDNLHYGGWENRSVHNAYGFTYHDATYKAIKNRLKDCERQRPFVLTRSYFAGSQRSAAVWTGDNISKWEYLKYSIPMILTSNVVNVPFNGADVGGFVGDPSGELLTRWYQTGIWYPFFRAHADIKSKRREPWIPGDPYTSIIRDAVKIRYSLLPVIYTAFYETNRAGTPIIKPLYYECPDNMDTYSIEDQFFLSNSGIMVKPVTNESAKWVSIYLPDNEKYYDYTNGVLSGKHHQLQTPGYIKKDVELSDIPILLKGGSIVARKMRYRRASKYMENDPYTLTIALDSNSNAKGKLYIDDGKSYNYLNNEFIKVDFSATNDDVSAKVFSPSDTYSKKMENVLVEAINITLDGSFTQVEIRQDGKTYKKDVVTSNGVLSLLDLELKINSNWSIKFLK